MRKKGISEEDEFVHGDQWGPVKHKNQNSELHRGPLHGKIRLLN